MLYLLDLARRVVDDLDDAIALLGRQVAGAKSEGHAEVLDGAHDLRIALGGAGRRTDGGHALEDLIDRGAVLFELLLPFLGDGVELARALGGNGSQTGLLEEG